MSIDARTAAWIAAWQWLEAAGQAVADFRKLKSVSLDTPLPSDLWVLIASADVYARLATADRTIGLMAGAWLEDCERERTEEDPTRSTREDFANLADSMAEGEDEKRGRPERGEPDD